jgi:outer membrane protein assembly factor BamE (lipoprotein component of BamABCDE complex)
MSTQIPGKAAAAIIIAATVFIVVALNQGTKRAEEQRDHDAREYAELVKKGRVRVGMTAEQCRTAWGSPAHVSSYTDPDRVYEKWTYPSGRQLLFANGVLKIVQKP